MNSQGKTGFKNRYSERVKPVLETGSGAVNSWGAQTGFKSDRSPVNSQGETGFKNLFSEAT